MKEVSWVCWKNKKAIRFNENKLTTDIVNQYTNLLNKNIFCSWRRVESPENKDKNIKNKYDEELWIFSIDKKQNDVTKMKFEELDYVKKGEWQEIIENKEIENLFYSSLESQLERRMNKERIYKLEDCYVRPSLSPITKKKPDDEQEFSFTFSLHFFITENKVAVSTYITRKRVRPLHVYDFINTDDDPQNNQLINQQGNKI